MKPAMIFLVIGVSLFLTRPTMSAPPQDSADGSSEKDVAQEQAATGPDEEFIQRMESAPPEERVPNWSNVKKLMARKAPNVGETAPDFMLKTQSGDEEIGVSQFVGKKPVVLIFGSYT